jgi:hypothetical protein
VSMYGMPIRRVLRYNFAATLSGPGACDKFRYDGLVSRNNEYN